MLRWANIGEEPALTVMDETAGVARRPPPPDLALVATVHPSSVPRSDRRDAAYADLVADLRIAADAAADAHAA